MDKLSSNIEQADGKGHQLSSETSPVYVKQELDDEYFEQTSDSDGFGERKDARLSREKLKVYELESVACSFHPLQDVKREQINHGGHEDSTLEIPAVTVKQEFINEFFDGHSLTRNTSPRGNDERFTLETSAGDEGAVEMKYSCHNMKKEIDPETKIELSESEDGWLSSDTSDENENVENQGRTDVGKHGENVKDSPLQEPQSSKASFKTIVEGSDQVTEIKVDENETCTKESDKEIPPEQHLWMEHGFQCYICDKKFTNMTELKSHCMIHIGYRDVPFKCEVCGKQCRDKRLWKAHLKIHSKVKVFPYQCGYCPKKYTQKRNLISHIRTHTGEQPFECTICHKKFQEKGSMIGHIRIHTGEKPYKCKICQESFTHHSGLANHKAVHTREHRIHNEERPYPCKDCGKEFRTKRNLNIHAQIHHPRDTPYQCQKCGKECWSEKRLSEHTRKINCLLASQQNQDEVHNKQMTGKRLGEQPFECLICDKKFQEIGSMIEHIRIHTGSNPINVKSARSHLHTTAGLQTTWKSTIVNIATIVRYVTRRLLLLAPSLYTGAFIMERDLIHVRSVDGHFGQRVT